jgi:hypothetical protein
MLGTQALGALALGQGPSGAVIIPAADTPRRGPIHRRRWRYDPDRIIREWEQAEAELQADIDAIEAAQEAARQAQEAKKAGQRKLKAQALERSLRGIELENAFLLEQLLALKAAAFEAEIARVMAELNAMMDAARLAELTLRRRRRDEEAMALLLLSDI